MISDDDLRKVIAGLVNLEELEISECHAVSVAGIRIVLQTLKHLRAFNFPTKEVNCDEVLREMARMPLPIRELNLEMANVTDEGLMSIAGLANSLERLALAGCKNVTNEGFKFLGRLAHVEDLDLDRLPQIESTPMAELLRNLPSVTSLSVSATKVDDNFLSMVADAPFARVCKKLNLSRTRITDEGLRNLHSFTKLSMVNLDGNPGITIEALSILAKLELPALVPPRLRISAPQQQQQQVHDEDHVEMDM
ncbi:RNI-like protein [Gonapodya prolifera JEL478]|uniref:RNI-like protein n=1 Tax=Gonapodya prolifera (strain JEL478) TaxID=1344416 RepID=A0A139AX21_GONPJ|nr:RNI-like protein [Gonapodya prolifera JEL478]|eukprot:KXS21123.1 RNI-like protein [Gonapodya prolifera JEL478]